MSRKGVMIGIAAPMLTLPAILALTHRQADYNTRFAAFVSAHPLVKLNYDVSINDRPTGKGAVLVDRKNKRFLAVCDSFGSTYTVSSTEKGYFEMDKASQSYDENPPPTHPLAIYASRISKAFQAIPASAMSQDLKNIFPGKPTATTKGSDTELYATKADQSGKIEVWATENQDGALTMLHVKKSGMISVDLKWNLSYEFPKSLPLAEMAPDYPLGYEPYSLDRFVYPLAKGKPLPTGWVKPGSTSAVDLTKLAGQKPFLLVFLDKGGPSQRAEDAVKELSAKLPVFTVGKDVADPNGKLTAAVNPPGWPTFVLAGSDGVVLQVWYGYDPEQKEGFEGEVMTAMSGGGKAKTP